MAIVVKTVKNVATFLSPIVNQLCNNGKPPTVIVVGDYPKSAIEILGSCKTISVAEINHSDEIEQLPIVDIALVLQTLVDERREILLQCIAWLRDVGAKKVLVLINGDVEKQSAHLNHHDLIALGLTPAAETQIEQTKATIFTFDISTYKSTPDWLSAKHWSNPNQWDKHRW